MAGAPPHPARILCPLLPSLASCTPEGLTCPSNHSCCCRCRCHGSVSSERNGWKERYGRFSVAAEGQQGMRAEPLQPYPTLEGSVQPWGQAEGLSWRKGGERIASQGSSASPLDLTDTLEQPNLIAGAGGAPPTSCSEHRLQLPPSPGRALGWTGAT